MVLKYTNMEEKKTKGQTSDTSPSIECSKCHKQISSANGTQKSNGFVCNECINKRKKRLLWTGIGCLIVVAGIALWALTDNHFQKNGKGFEGVGDIQDSVTLSVKTNNVRFNLAATTAINSPVSTQAPISNLADFKNIFSQNVADATNKSSKSLVIPAVCPLFEINTNHFTNDGDALVREFASAYNMTNKKATILVEGYTCDLGGVRLNDKLSEVRAETVKNILIDAGIPENMIEVKWYGKSRFHEFNYPNKNEYRRVILSIK